MADEEDTKEMKGTEAEAKVKKGKKGKEVKKAEAKDAKEVKKAKEIEAKKVKKAEAKDAKEVKKAKEVEEKAEVKKGKKAKEAEVKETKEANTEKAEANEVKKAKKEAEAKDAKEVKQGKEEGAVKKRKEADTKAKEAKERPPPPAWLDAAFVQEALRQGGGADADAEGDVHVEDVEVGYAGAAGDNYCSSLLRVRARLRGRGLRPLVLLVKLLPPAGQWSALVLEARLFDREAIVFSRVLPAMHALLREVAPEQGQPFAARCYREARYPEPYIVLQDLGPENFRMKSRHAGLDLEHALLTARALGRFHGTSAVLYKRQPELFHGLDSFFDDKGSDACAEYYDKCLETTANTIATYKNFQGNFEDKVNALRKNIFQKWKEINRIRPGKFNALIHGDFWVNNMLYRYKDREMPKRYKDKEVEDIRFVDFQLSHVGNPAIDLTLLHYVCLTEEVFDKHWDTLLETYREALEESMKLLGEEAPSLEDIRQDLEEARAYAFLAALIWLPNVKIEGKVDLDEIIAFEEKIIHKSPILQIWLRKILPIFDKEGMFDEVINME